jgi:cell wall assembly regulator SMI1
MSDDRIEILGRSWAYIVAWCEAHAPATAAAFHGPVDEAALAGAQVATGREWPEQLVTWLRWCDGADRSFDAELIPPGFIPMGVARITQDWEMLTRIFDDLVDADELTAAEGLPAGTNSPAFLRSWVPFAEDCGGSFLFVDVRGGPRHGCVCEFGDGEGYLRGPLWDDVASMLSDVAGVLRGGRWVSPFDPDYDRVRRVVDGRLSWESGPASQWRTANRPVPTPEEQRIQIEMLLWEDWSDDRIAAELGVPVAQVVAVRADLARQAGERQAAERNAEAEAVDQPADGEWTIELVAYEERPDAPPTEE